jgi:hypothetical protein
MDEAPLPVVEDPVKSRLVKLLLRIVIVPIEDVMVGAHKKLGPKAKLAVAFAGVLILVAVWFRGWTAQQLVDLYYWSSTPSAQASPPEFISHASRDRLVAARKALMSDLDRAMGPLSAGLESRSFVIKDSWELSQTVKALKLPKDHPAIANTVKFIAEGQDNETELWRQFGNNGVMPEHFGHSGWCLLALSLYQQSPPTKSVESVLSQQFEDGAFPFAHIRRDGVKVPKHAEAIGSVYVTAIMTWALCAYAERPDLSDAEKARALASVQESMSWLSKMISAGKIGASDYPEDVSARGEASVGLLGFAIYVVLDVDARLHGKARIVTEGMLSDWAEDWASVLSSSRFGTLSHSRSNRVVYCGKGLYIYDCIANYHLPWALGASAKLLPYMNRRERAVVSQRLDELLERADREVPALAGGMPWFQAEFVMATAAFAGE